MKIEISEGMADDDREAIYGWLREHNQTHNPKLFEFWEAGDEPKPIRVVARAEDGRPIGGLHGKIELAWLKIDILSVDPECRRRGIGRQLVEAAESEATSRGCRYAFADTMDYQAAEFFPRLGYVCAGQIPDWDSFGHTKFFFRKELRQSDLR